MVADFVPATEHLGHGFRAQHVSQRGLCQQAGGLVHVLHVGDGQDGITHPEVHDCVHLDRYGIFTQNLEHRDSSSVEKVVHAVGVGALGVLLARDALCTICIAFWQPIHFVLSFILTRDAFRVICVGFYMKEEMHCAPNVLHSGNRSSCHLC